MKRWSIKGKLTVLYACFMTLLTCAALGILFSLSNQEILSSVQSELKDAVQESMDAIEGENGGLDIDSDFFSLENGVYLSLYTEDGEFLYGRLPRGFDERPAFMDDRLQSVGGSKEKWYVFDLSHEVEDYGVVYVRGITSVTKAENSMRVTLRFAMILLPLLVVVTVIIGYRFTRRAFLPVKRMTDTVRAIQEGTDLSRRIHLPPGRDEISYLAGTFDHMLERLETSFGRERQFTSDVSHELRTPVTVMLMQCDELLGDETLSEEQRRQVQVIRRKAAEMSAMISQLLLLSRADQGRQNLQKEFLNISELTEMAAEEQVLFAAEKNIAVETDIRENIQAWVDESFYIRLLVNLISNAVYYGKEGGYVKISLFKTEDEAVLRVSDNGIGISREALPHIWKRFYRADTARSDSSHSGLGLSMVKWIAEAHGGGIEAESEAGKGSVFTCRLPLGRAEAENLSGQ